MTTIKTLKKHSNSVDLFNSIAAKYLLADGKFDIPLKPELNKKGQLSNKDVFSYYFREYPFKLQIKQLFADLPKLRNYPKPLNKPRLFNSYGQGRFTLNFCQLVPYTKDPNAKKKAGRPVPILNGKTTKCIRYDVASICDENGVKFTKQASKIKLTEEDYITFSLTNQLIAIAKEFYNQLSKEYIYKKGRDKDYQLKLFNSIYSLKDFFDLTLEQKTVKKLEGEEHANYKALMEYKYNHLREIIISKSIMFLNMLDDMNNHIKLHNAKSDLHAQLSDNTDADLEELNEQFKSPAKVSTVHIGIPYLVVNQLKKLNIYHHLHKSLTEESLDLLVDYVSQLLLYSVSENGGLKVSQGKIYKLSHAKSFSRQFYKVATKLNSSSESNCKLLQQTISTTLFQNEVNNSTNKTLLLLDSTLVKSGAKNIFYNSYSVSKVDGLVKCFKLSLIQTEKGIPLLLDTSSSSRKDVSDFTHLLDDLKERNVDTDKIIICADAGYFSQFNQVYSQSLKINYLLLAKNINVVVDSILEHSRAYKVISYDPETQSSIFSKVINYSDYIYANSYYLDELESRQQEYNPDYKISDLKDNQLKIVNIFNTEVQKTEEDKFLKDFSKYCKENSYATHTKELKQSVFKKMFKMEDEKITFNLEEIEKRVDLLGYNSLMTNMLDVDDKELVNAYRKRMSIEHSFKKLKSSFDLKAFYKHINATTELKCLANWLALIVYNTTKVELEESSSNRVIDTAKKSFSQDGVANVDKLLSAMHIGLVVEFKEHYSNPNYYIQTTDSDRALTALGFMAPMGYNYGNGFVEFSTRFKKYQDKMNALYKKLNDGKITNQEFNILIKDKHIIDY